LYIHASWQATPWANRVKRATGGGIDHKVLPGSSREGKIDWEGKDAGGGFTVASLHVKGAKVVHLVPILQIVQIEKSISYLKSVG
jgi:hypothetical protein